MHLRWIDQEAFDRLIGGMTRIHRFAGAPEVLTGHHEHLGFVALIRHEDIFVALLNEALGTEREVAIPDIEPMGGGVRQ